MVLGAALAGCRAAPSTLAGEPVIDPEPTPRQYPGWLLEQLAAAANAPPPGPIVLKLRHGRHDYEVELDRSEQLLTLDVPEDEEWGDEQGEIAATLYPQVSAAAASRALAEEFLADPLRSRPLGFYTWSPQLGRLFRRDRLLQSPLPENAAAALARTLARDGALSAGYRAVLALAERLTNPLAAPDLREMAAAIERGETPVVPLAVTLFPPSRSHETDLVRALYGERSIPDGFDLAKEMIQRIRAGTLDLTPTPASGWYDHQTYALEPLVAPDRMPEAARLWLSPSYRRELEALFKALLALGRETHVKQLELAVVGAAPMPPVLRIAPDLRTEPLASYYLRRARSHLFVRDMLTDTFGREGWAAEPRLTAGGPINVPLAEELQMILDLFYGAYLWTCRDIGLSPERDPRLGPPARALAVFVAWSSVQVELDPQVTSLVYPVTAELYVEEVLPRERFRCHCDEHKTYGDIVARLR